MSDKYPGGFVTANAPAGFSVALNGSSDYLTTANSLGINNFGTGDFTIESWINFNVVGNGQIVSAGDGSVSNAYFWQYYSSQLSFGAQSIGSIAATNWSPVANTWYHVAVTRSGTSIRQFVNGVQLGSTVTSSQNFIDGPTWIGNAGAGYFNGYISNVRVIKGTALYTTTFTPPTQLFPVTNTTLLTCQSPTLVDNSTTAATITAVSGAKVSNFTPFAAYQGFNPALGAAAGGVWTIDEAAYYQQNRLWPIYDPYFNQTTLMLHGNSTGTVDSTGTPVYQNNTFLDSSNNNFPITRNGNTTQGSFSPFSQTGWSNFGTGVTTEGISSATSSAYTFGTGDWCVEMWFYRAGDGPSPSFNETLIDMRDADVTGNGVCIGTKNNGSIFIYDASVTTSTGVFSNNTWNHLVYSRQSGVIKLFINGAMLYSGAYTNNYTNTNCRILRNSVSGYGFNGYMSNVRIIKGNVPAQYQGTGFAVPTAPLTAVTGTSLLTCQDNRFVDNSANNFAITANSAPSVQAFSPFVPAYITPTTYSNWFDGSTGYLSFPSSANFTFGTGDYTVEAWVNLNTSSTYQTMFGSSTTDALMFNIYSMNSVVIQTAGSNIFATFSGATFATNTWYHVAVSRSSGTVKAFVNGVQYGSTITSNTTNYALPTTNTIGSNAASQYFGGCLSSLRIVKGGALYTANFTPSTEPLTTTVSAGTVSLLTCQNSTFIDNSASANTLTATGSVKPVTSPTPFPANVDTTTLNSAYSTSLIGGSGYFDGTGDNLTVPSNAAWQFDTGDFTIETWIYISTIQSFEIVTVLTNSAFFWQYQNATPRLAFGVQSGSSFTSSWTPVINNWYHLAVSRVSGTTTQYVNGVSIGSTATSLNISATGTLSITVGASSGGPFNGYFSGLRIVKGSAVYTGNFAVPTAPPTTIANTQLLVNYTNGAIFDNTAKNVLETAGNAQISTAQSKFGGSSMYFDGTGDFLATGKAPILDGIGGDFTIEYWQYPVTGVNGQYVVLGSAVSSYAGNAISFVYVPSTNNFYSVFNTTAGPNYTGGSYLNTWTHVAWVRNGSGSNNCTLYLNGVSVATSTYTGTLNLNTTNSNTFIGKNGWDASYLFTGYLDDLRITLAARYKANFTPPTSQLQDQ